MFKDLLLEYCTESSIHGMRYLADKRKTPAERLFWMMFLALSIACCCWFTYNLYMNAEQSSIVMTISNRPLIITDIPFPSLTICSTIPFNISRLNATALLFGENTSQNFNEDELFALLAQFCNIPDLRQTPQKQFDYIATLLKANLRLNYMQSCRFGIKRHQCREDFQEIITNLGLCYTYNSLSAKELFRSHNGTTFDFFTNMVQIENSKNQLKNILGQNERGRLDINFKAEATTFEELCKPSAEGFQIALRSPHDVVILNSADVRIKEDYVTELSLTPKVLHSNENLRSFHIDQRECYFDNERQLYFLRYYTQENCHFECLTNITLKKCGCVLYYMPRLKITPICFGERLLNCAEEIEETYDNMGIGPCRCYDLCNSISFQVSVATHKMNINNFLDENKGKFIQTRIGVFTKEKNVLPLHRSQLYGFNDWVASFGGLLGLFLGISILSIIELFYYIIMRPMCLWLTQSFWLQGAPFGKFIKIKPTGANKRCDKQQFSLTGAKTASTIMYNWMSPYDFRRE